MIKRKEKHAAVIPEEQITASREIAEKLGAKLRVRAFDE